MPGLEWQGDSQPGLVNEDTMKRLVLENAVLAITTMPDLNGAFATLEEEGSFEKELYNSKGQERNSFKWGFRKVRIYNSSQEEGMHFEH